MKIITIDGQSGVGKGTIGLRLANHLGYHFLDSGAVYRSIGYLYFNQDLTEEDILSLPNMIKINFEVDKESYKIFLNGEDVTNILRSEDIAKRASILSADPKIREQLVSVQHAFAIPPGLVADGRDMGTVIFKEAAVKIFLSASPEVRALRRFKQLQNQGVHAKFDEILSHIKDRDMRDSTRKVSPLVPAADAHVIDTSELGIEEVFSLVKEIVHQYNN